MSWLRANKTEIAVDPVILGELRFGILILPKGSKRRALERWFNEGIERLYCVPEMGGIAGTASRNRKAMPIKDRLIAATAVVHGLVIATRNGADFVNAGVRVVDPFVA